MTPDALAAVERIRQLPIPDNFKPVLIDAASYALERADRFGAAIAALDHQADGAGDLHNIITDMARHGFSATGPAAEYADWRMRLLLLTALAVSPIDMTRFGKCGAISWETSMVKTGRRKHQVDLALGRSWILFDLHGAPHDEMLDKEGEHIEHRYGELVDGKRQDVVKRTPWKERGILGKLVDQLKPILDDLHAREPSTIQTLTAHLRSLQHDPGAAEQNPADTTGLAGDMIRDAHAADVFLAGPFDELHGELTHASDALTAWRITVDWLRRRGHLSCEQHSVTPAVVADAFDRAAAAASAPPAGEQPPAGTPALSEKQRDILVAMLEMQAFDSDSRKTTDEIAERVEGRGANGESYKQPVARLVRAKLLDRKRGAGGGLWLTPTGRLRAEQLKRKV
jgi:hypothetical protein